MPYAWRAIRFLSLGHLRQQNRTPDLQIKRIANLAEYRAHIDQSISVHQSRWLKELRLAASEKEFHTKGFCYPCNKEVEFSTDFLYSHTTVNNKPVPNWRERVLCPQCNMNNRTRASIQLLEKTINARRDMQIYIAEQVTPLYQTLKNRFAHLTGSEYLGNEISFGLTNQNGIRNESITKLTFADNVFDVILNFDVLEHVPDVDSALKEIYRVLKPRGNLLLSVPFLSNDYENQVRAQLDNNGDIVHLLTPQYHGDPTTAEGCLCFQDFGWSLLDQMRLTGFTDVNMLLYWSDALGYYGVEQMMITAKKAS